MVDEPEKLSHELGVQFPGARIALQLVARLVKRPSRPVRPRCRDRIERVYHTHDLRRQWNGVAAQSVRVAAAIPSFVMATNGDLNRWIHRDLTRRRLMQGALRGDPHGLPAQPYCQYGESQQVA